MTNITRVGVILALVALPWGISGEIDGVKWRAGAAWADDDDGDDDDDGPTRTPRPPRVPAAPRTPPPAARPPVVRAPVVRAPVVQAPAVRAPVVQAPVVQAPVVQAPAVQAPTRRVQAPVPPAPVRQAPPPPTRAPDEIVALDLDDADLATLLARGFAVIEERSIARLDVISRRLQIPQGIPLEEARDLVRALDSGGDADFNHYYRSEQGAPDPEPRAPVCDGLHCASLSQISWPVEIARGSACDRDIAIGMIDTGLNPDHETFEDAQLELHRLTEDALDPSRAIHGTAVAALLIGDHDSRSPGLMPDARLVALDVFHRDASDERADVFTLVDGLGFLADADVRVINLSLAGPANTVLEETINRLVAENGIVIVAAAGNGGPSAEPAYPAAYHQVIAVTAVDQSGAVYRRAGRGPHIEFAAPGVEVWTAASISGARAKTGTSFAAPFVAAAAALILQDDPTLTPEGVRLRLAATARDLGEAGRDDTYGFGLISLEGVCDARLSPAAPR
ncbi:MAG: S8 family serine peptidase [Rhodobacterales bacterium]|nr:S8 family serine peptidase [Rhodobacterales bacterium]